jgi:hypothetical protein
MNFRSPIILVCQSVGVCEDGFGGFTRFNLRLTADAVLEHAMRSSFAHRLFYSWPDGQAAGASAM